MKYFADFQYLPNGAERPQDSGGVIEIETSDEGFFGLPSVGDYVEIHTGPERASFDGRVKSRLFRYFNLHGEKTCAVNIVVEQADEADWGLLVKE